MQNDYNILKRTLQVFLGVALVAQLTGCVYYAGEGRYHPYWYHPAAVVVHVHD